ncbi:MAG: hypothetical protein KF830_15265 [Planctomycetes bacterium]|nr:hypothetical protein [Planctomycetota bacterium]
MPTILRLPPGSRHALLAGLLACAGCSSSTYKVGIAVDPPTASVYVNGERVGAGSRRVYEIDFGANERICIQAVASSHEPVTEMFTRQQINDQISKYGDFSWVLKQEK